MAIEINLITINPDPRGNQSIRQCFVMSQEETIPSEPNLVLLTAWMEYLDFQNCLVFAQLVVVFFVLLYTMNFRFYISSKK
jgi:hypothetical protein